MFPGMKISIKKAIHTQNSLFEFRIFRYILATLFCFSYACLSYSQSEDQKNQDLQELIESNPEKGRKVILGLLETNPTQAKLLILLGTIQLAEGDHNSAVIQFNKAIKEESENVSAHKLLGQTYIQVGDMPKAIAPLQRAIELGDKNASTFGLLGYALAHRIDNLDKAEAAFNEASRIANDSSKWSKQYVKILMQWRKFEKALTLLNKLPTDKEALRLKSQIHLQLGLMRKAAKNLELLDQKETPDAQSLVFLGNLYLKSGALYKSVNTFKRATNLKSLEEPLKSIEVPVKILLSKKAWFLAEDLLNHYYEVYADEITNDEKHIYFELKGRSLIEKGDSILDLGLNNSRGIQLLQSALSLQPNDGDLILYLGDLFTQKNQQIKAIEYYDRALKLEFFKTNALIKKAQLLIKNGTSKYPEAIALLKQANQRNPNPSVENFIKQLEKRIR